jgi:5-methylcytosine-specific restriction endonuclease McrA
VCLAQRRRAVWQRKNARRRGANPIGPLVSVAQLGARDGWRCHLCRRRVDAALPYQHAMAGTRDHLVPVTDGGDDSGANLRLAHRSCNSRRGVRGSVQLALVG